jgi:hypothetical protein
LDAPGQAVIGRPARVRSALTQEVKVIEDRKGYVHAALVKIKSGQLPFLGSSGANDTNFVAGPEFFTVAALHHWPRTAHAANLAPSLYAITHPDDTALGRAR